MDLLPLYRIPILSGLEYDDESEVEVKDFVQLGASSSILSVDNRGDVGVRCCCCFLEFDGFDRSELIDRRAFNFFPPVVGVVNGEGSDDNGSSVGDCDFNLPKNPFEDFLETVGLGILLSLRVNPNCNVLLLSNRPLKSPRSSYALNTLAILGLGGRCSCIEDEDVFLLGGVGEAVCALYSIPSQAIVGGFPIIHV